MGSDYEYNNIDSEADEMQSMINGKNHIVLITSALSDILEQKNSGFLVWHCADGPVRSRLHLSAGYWVCIAARHVSTI